MISWFTAFVFLTFSSVVLNALVDWLKAKTGGRHPLTSFLVVVGVSYTVAVALLIDYGKYPVGDQWYVSWQTLFECFAISGIPMIAGDVGRWLRTMRGE